jgi:hypothetical protein
LNEIRPDVVLVSPLITGGSTQTDYIKDAQRDEAVRLHGVPRERVVVTGAQPFDRWFGHRPTLSREAFCRRVGLHPERPFLLFTGSTSNITDPGAEDRFVRRWAEAVRTARAPQLREAGLLVRPHPDRRGDWSNIDLEGLEEAVVWPPARPNSVTEEARAEYFDSLYHASVVVGINTSAMVEAAILGRPVLSLRLPEFHKAQRGTLHFAHMLPEHGGFLDLADSLGEHLAQVQAAMEDPGPAQRRNRAFVERFVRTQGAQVPATPKLVAAVEQLDALGTRPRPRGLGAAAAARAAARPCGARGAPGRSSCRPARCTTGARTAARRGPRPGLEAAGAARPAGGLLPSGGFQAHRVSATADGGICSRSAGHGRRTLQAPAWSPRGLPPARRACVPRAARRAPSSQPLCGPCRSRGSLWRAPPSARGRWAVAPPPAGWAAAGRT